MVSYDKKKKKTLVDRGWILHEIILMLDCGDVLYPTLIYLVTSHFEFLSHAGGSFWTLIFFFYLKIKKIICFASFNRL